MIQQTEPVASNRRFQLDETRESYHLLSKRAASTSPEFEGCPLRVRRPSYIARLAPSPDGAIRYVALLILRR
jgi:hypothetical protein